MIFRNMLRNSERETGFEPATLGLGSRCSTTELFPHSYSSDSMHCNPYPDDAKLQKIRL